MPILGHGKLCSKEVLPAPAPYPSRHAQSLEPHPALPDMAPQPTFPLKPSWAFQGQKHITSGATPHPCPHGQLQCLIVHTAHPPAPFRHCFVGKSFQLDSGCQGDSSGETLTPGNTIQSFRVQRCWGPHGNWDWPRRLA